MKLPAVNSYRQRTAQQTVKHKWPNTLDAGKIKKAPEQYPTTTREPTEEDQTRPSDFGWISGNPF
ncbi:hypothetical protein [Desulfobacter sp.]|uniref:hypothetical protein n=1 Tax=Desulfobacter sp. TaxID=2294 RepID=UPI003D0F7C71